MAAIDPTTSNGLVRLRIGDTSATDDKRLLSDAEIDALLSARSNNVNLAASDACMVLAAQAALLSNRETIGLHTVDNSKLSEYYMKLADQYRNTDAQTPAMGIAEIRLSDFTGYEIDNNQAIRAY